MVSLQQKRAEKAKQLFAELHDSRYKKTATFELIAERLLVSPRTVERYIYAGR